MCEVAAVYSDGGSVAANPSRIAGTFAWRHVDVAGKAIRSGRGSITPGQLGAPEVYAYVTEFLAATAGLEHVPSGWSGVLYTDSQQVLLQIVGLRPGNKPATMGRIPEWLQARGRAAVARLGGFSVVLLGGHPRQAELAAGYNRKGLPVSRHNVWCDAACTKVARQLLRRNGRSAA